MIDSLLSGVCSSFCIIDKNKTCVGVTVYNIAPGWGVKIGDSVAIPQPHYRHFNFTYRDEVCIRKYHCQNDANSHLLSWICSKILPVSN